jgi:actin-related protein
MSEIQKYKYPLLIIAVLCMFKFIIVPTMTWQDSLIAENKLLQRKVNKVNLLLADETELAARLKTAQSQLNQATQYFYSYQAEQEFRLAQQKIIEQQLTNFELKSSTIGWQNVVTIPNTPLIRFQLQYSFSGQSEQVIAFLLSQQKLQQWQEAETLNINVRRQKAGRLGQMTVTTRISFYMLNKDLSDA